MEQKICVMRKDKYFYFTITIEDREIENKSDEEIADIIMNKLRIEMNKIMYGKRGV